MLQIKLSLRMVALTIVGVVVIGGLILWSLTTDRRTDVSTRVERKSLRFYKQGEGKRLVPRMALQCDA